MEKRSWLLFCWSEIVDAIVVAFVVMVGTKEMGVVVLLRKLCLVVAWLRNMCWVWVTSPEVGDVSAF